MARIFCVRLATKVALLNFRVSAPGKTILIGEHAAVYGRPALIAAIDRRTVAEISTGDNIGQVDLDLPRVGVRESLPWSEVLTYTRHCREAWRAYRERPDPESFARVRGGDPAHLVKIALGEAMLDLGEERPAGIRLRLDSQIPVGSGFGSSAAAAAAVVEVCLALHGATRTPEQLQRLTLDVERRQHGLPSGVDNATVIHGGLVRAEKEPSGELAVSVLEARSGILEEIRVFHSGTPAEPTGTMVAAVRSLQESDPAKFEKILERMERATEVLRQEIENTSASPGRVVAALRTFEACLEEIGVVPEPVQEIVRRVEELGGAAKISGAGALSGTGAGSLLIYHPRGEVVEDWDFLGKLERLDLRLGARGLCREEPSPGLFLPTDNTRDVSAPGHPSRPPRPAADENPRWQTSPAKKSADTGN